MRIYLNIYTGEELEVIQWDGLLSTREEIENTFDLDMSSEADSEAINQLELLDYITKSKNGEINVIDRETFEDDYVDMSNQQFEE